MEKADYRTFPPEKTSESSPKIAWRDIMKRMQSRNLSSASDRTHNASHKSKEKVGNKIIVRNKWGIISLGLPVKAGRATSQGPIKGR